MPLTRLRWILPVVSLVVPFVATSTSDAAPAAPAPTIRVVVAPVTASGHAASGFTVHKQNDADVSCSPAEPSPVSISKNVEECSPSAAYAVACWKASTPGRTLCIRDPRSRKIYSLELTGRFAKTPAAPPRRRAPFVVVLGDGSVCKIRIGGTGAILKSHPNYYTTYYCTGGGAIWAKSDASHDGVDESAAAWTVRTASSDGTGGLHTRRVIRAYFVATA